MTVLHVVANLGSSLAREDKPVSQVIGAYWSPSLAEAVRRVASGAVTLPVDIDAIAPGYRKAMEELSIPGRPKADVAAHVPLATLQDLLSVETEGDFEQVLAELPEILRTMRKHTKVPGYAGFVWPIRWRQDGSLSTITTHGPNGSTTEEIECTADVHPAEALDLENTVWRQENAARLAACWSLMEGVPTNKFDGRTLAEYVSREAYLQSMEPAEDQDGAVFKITGMACQMMAEAFAGQFEGSGATNFLEVGMSHDTLGPFTVTIQRTQGKTPGELRAEALECLQASNTAVQERDARIAYLESGPAMNEDEKAKFWDLAHEWARSTVDTPKRAASLVAFVDERRACPVDVVQAMGGYLRRCRSGGMTKAASEKVAAAVQEAQNLGYFKPSGDVA